MDIVCLSICLLMDIWIIYIWSSYIKAVINICIKKMKCITFSNFFIPLLNVYGTKDLKMKLYFETCYFGKISFIFMYIHTFFSTKLS